MGKKITIQKREKNNQFTITLPSAIAKAMNFKKGDQLFWSIASSDSLLLSKIEK